MWTQIKDELRFLALEVSGSFKERWEGPPQPIRTLLYQPLSSKLHPLSPPPASLKGTRASRNEFEIRRRIASTSVCTGARIWGRLASRTQILKTRSGTPTSSSQSAYVWGVCKHTCRHTLQGHWSKTQRLTETSLNSDQKSYWQISANNHIHLTD